ncbi:MAG: TetR/AcrR family transcriptional regulator [Thermodesulfobacteriota bacterium]
MKWERARTDKQKEKRISEIVSATDRLFKKYGYDSITFVSIAKEANFTRSNLYKYFNSKEEIFLELFKKDISLWRKALVAKYPRDKNYSIKEFASIWVTVMNKHKRLLDLIGIWFSSLESQCSVESLTKFKLRTKDELKMLQELLCTVFPAMKPKRAAEFIHLQIASAIGLYQMTNLSENQKKVLQNPELRDMNIDFYKYYMSSVEHLISGLLDQDKERYG